VKVTVRFAWYDMWMGVYVDRKARRVYVCPLPCLLFTFSRRHATGGIIANRHNVPLSDFRMPEPLPRERLIFGNDPPEVRLVGVVRGVPYASEFGGVPLVPDENGMIDIPEGGRFWIGFPPAEDEKRGRDVQP